MATEISSKNVAVFGIYATAALAETAVDQLLEKGFSNSAISVLLPEDESTRAFAHEKQPDSPRRVAVGMNWGRAALCLLRLRFVEVGRLSFGAL
jgi:hypothetical protein